MLRDPKSKSARSELQGNSPLNSLARRYYAPLLSFFRKRTHTGSDTQDLVQQVFLHLAQSRQQGEIHNPDAYIFQTAANALRDYYRHLSVHNRFLNETIAASDGNASAVVRRMVFSILSLLAAVALAEPPANPPARQSETELNTITVEAARDRAILERRVNTFVSGITMAPYQQSLARWKKETPICPQVAGLPYLDGEYVLSHFSQIAAAAGAALAPDVCGPNLYILVSSVPNELIAEWSKRNPWMFGRAGGTKIRQFLSATAPVRVWYNTAFFNGDGKVCKISREGIPICEQGAQISQIRLASVRDLTSVIVLVDARQIKEINMGQLAAYIAMVGLAEIRIDAKPGDAPTILHLFTDSANAPALGMSGWDTAYLKALYHTEHDDKTQLLALKASMIKEVAP